MATLRCRLNQKNADNTYSVVHLETEASLVLMSDGRTLETALAGIDDDLAAGGKHASTHAISGTDPVTPGMIGAATADDIAPLTNKLNELQDMLDDAVNKVLTTINTVPYPKNTLIYTGEEQSPEWNGYDPEVMTIGGVIAQTDAGEYEVIFLANKGYQWADGSVVKTVTWTIERAVIAAVPSQSGTLTYTGSVQSPILSGYDSTKMSISGNTGTNAGNYTAAVTPNSNYKWSDNTTESKDVSWNIGKAAGSISLDKTSVSFTSAGGSQQVTVTRPGTGAISASSSNTNVATCSVNGNVITVSNGSSNGTSTITVNVAEDDNHTAASATISVTRNVYVCPVSASLGATVNWAGYTWNVVHVTNSLVYLALSTIYEMCVFNPSTGNNSYYGSRLATRAKSFEDSIASSILDDAANVTVEGVTAKIFAPSLDQVVNEFDYFRTGGNNSLICTYNYAQSLWWLSSKSTDGSSKKASYIDAAGNVQPGGASISNTSVGFRPFVAIKRQ